MNEIERAVRWMLQRMIDGEPRHYLWEDAVSRYRLVMSRTDLIDAYFAAERRLEGEETTLILPRSVLDACLTESRVS